MGGQQLLLNGAVFYQDYEDFQLNTFTGMQFVVTSLPQVVSQGVDLDMRVVHAARAAEPAGRRDLRRDDDRRLRRRRWRSSVRSARTTRCRSRRNGRRSLSATFEQPIGANLLFRANVGAKYTSEYNTGSNLDPRKIQDALTLVNARLGFGADDERWMVELWAQNLTDEEYYQVAFDATLQGSSAGAVPTSTIDAFLGAPHTYGVTARFKF